MQAPKQFPYNNLSEERGKGSAKSGLSSLLPSSS